MKELIEDKEWLKYNYVTLRKTSADIGREVGVSRRTVSRRITKFGIVKDRPNAKLPFYININCAYCEKVFEMGKNEYQIRSHNSENLHCTRECFIKTRSRLSSGKNNPNYGGTYAGLHYRDMTDEQKESRDSKIRDTILANGSRRGELNPHWKGGITPLTSNLRGSTDNWRQSTLELYDYKCAITGSTRNLEVHHVYPFYKVRDEVMDELGIDPRPTLGDYTEEEIDSMKERLEEYHKYAMGVPLTEEYHKKFHEEYGHDVDLYDFIEFRNKWKE